MLWWFERNGKHVRLEVLHLANGKHELHMWDEDDREITETFHDHNQLTQRQRAIHDALAAEGWRQSGEWVL
jgi:hypothetical protein